MRALTFGDRLRSERERHGWTRAELAGHAGVSRPLVAALEQGHSNPTLETLQGLAAALGLKLSELVGEESPPAERLSAEDRRLLGLLHGLPEDRRRLAWDVLRVFGEPMTAAVG